jgi:nucleoside-diphosphate-sugar epimerase
MILVTGGRGFIGTDLVSRLRARGERVRVLTRRGGRTGEPRNVDEVVGDLRDPPSLERAVTDVTCVVHLAAAVGDHDAGLLTEINVDGTAALADAARAAGVRRFIHVSSAGVYGSGASRRLFLETDPPSPETAYERSKLESEEALRRALTGSPVRWVVLRPTGVYGAGREATEALVRQVIRKRVWLHGPAEVLVHPTYVADAVSAIELVLVADLEPGLLLNVAGERPLAYVELIDEIGARLGRTPRHLRLPGWTAPLAGLGSSLASAAGLATPRLERLTRRRVNRGVDIGRIRALLGFDPTPLGVGLDETLRAMGLPS